MINLTEKKSTVLVVDAEPGIRRLLRVCLERHGYNVVEAATGDAGIEEAIRCRPDAVLLDTELPDMPGMDVLKQLREWSQTPVLVVSECDIEHTKIAALDSGANDYITKPFSPNELMARLRVAQRGIKPAPQPEVFQFGDMSVDFITRTVRKRAEKVKLTPTEYSLLHLFVQNASKVLTHGQILRSIWGVDQKKNPGFLRVYLTYLREKLENNPGKPELFITEPGVGYRLALQE